ncbi:MAG: flavin oxidoreductase/NADH oxidase [Clostridia bacterium]|nr:flavin oxidoreductase/NADH oxidase [Clostridia bacterium]
MPFEFKYQSLDDVKADAAVLGLDLPFSADLSCLAKPICVKGDNITLKNAVAIHPMEGFDSTPNGAPSELTRRRYLRFANSDAGLYWFEAVAISHESRSNARQLWINRDNVDEYKKLVDELHRITDGAPVICQLTHSGRFSRPENLPAPIIAYHNPILNRPFNIPAEHKVVTDEYLDTLVPQYVEAAKLAYEAGFDGVDIKACHRYLLSELLSAFTREGKYGGSFENRTRLYRDIIAAVKAELGNKLIVATRLGVHDAIGYPYGFCDDREKPENFAPDEAIRLIDDIHKLGVNLINITMGTPYFNPHVNRPYCKGGYEPPEHPLVGVARMLDGAALLTKEFPDITFIGTGYTFLRQFAPYLAAGAVGSGMISAAGFGRMAFAYDGFAKDLMAGEMKPNKCCVTCGKCTELMRAYTTTGCPVRDSEVYAPIYKAACANK